MAPRPQVYPAPAALRQARGADTLRLLGLTVGKALYEGLLLDAELAPPFVLALQRRPPQLEDLASLDADLYRSLLQVFPARTVCVTLFMRCCKQVHCICEHDRSSCGRC